MNLHPRGFPLQIFDFAVSLEVFPSPSKLLSFFSDQPITTISKCQDRCGIFIQFIVCRACVSIKCRFRCWWWIWTWNIDDTTNFSSAVNHSASVNTSYIWDDEEAIFSSAFQVSFCLDRRTKNIEILLTDRLHFKDIGTWLKWLKFRPFCRSSTTSFTWSQCPK